MATSPEPAYRDLIDPRGRGFEANRRIGRPLGSTGHPVSANGTTIYFVRDVPEVGTEKIIYFSMGMFRKAAVHSWPMILQCESILLLLSGKDKNCAICVLAHRYNPTPL